MSNVEFDSAVELDEAVEVSVEDIIAETDDYFVFVALVHDPLYQYPYKAHKYCVANKDTGVREKEIDTLPAAINWMTGLQGALDEVSAQMEEKEDEELQQNLFNKGEDNEGQLH